MLQPHEFDTALPASAIDCAGHRAAGAGVGGAVAALGNITESAATSVKETLQRLSGRRRRYEMKRIAGQIVGGRVDACQRVPSYGVQHNGASRGISKNAEGQASFHGVGSCGDVWNCPVCALRIASGRKDEIKQAMSVNRKQGGSCLLVTWTFPHKRTDVLAEILASFLASLRSAKSWRGYKKARDQVGYIGQIRALEVNHGDANGWHPHCHEVWFSDRQLQKSDAIDLKNALHPLWVKACRKHGLPDPSEQFGVDVQIRSADQGAEDDAAGSYISKWGDELVYSNFKTGKQGSRTPWAILSDLTDSYSYRDACLFREYSDAFRGRAQLFWSRGLKAMFQIEEFADEVIADRPEKEIVRDLDVSEWAAICKTRSHAQVLEVAEFQPDRLDAFIRSLVDRVLSWSRDSMYLRQAIQLQTEQTIAEMGFRWPD